MAGLVRRKPESLQTVSCPEERQEGRQEFKLLSADSSPLHNGSSWPQRAFTIVPSPVLVVEVLRVRVWVQQKRM